MKLLSRHSETSRPCSAEIAGHRVAGDIDREGRTIHTINGEERHIQILVRIDNCGNVPVPPSLPGIVHLTL